MNRAMRAYTSSLKTKLPKLKTKLELDVSIRRKPKTIPGEMASKSRYISHLMRSLPTT